MKGISLTKEDIFREKAYQININKEEPIKCFGDELEDDYDTNSESITATK